MPAPKRRSGTKKGPANPSTGLASAAHSDTSAIVHKIIAEGHQDGDAPGDDATSITTVSGKDSDIAWSSLHHFAHRPDNPRWQREYDPDGDPELAAFIGTLEHYRVLQPVSVTSLDAWLAHHPEHGEQLSDSDIRYVVIMGNRRLAGARCYGLEGLPYHRNDALADPLRSKEAPLIENYHRKPLDAVREAAEMAAVLDKTGESKRSFADRLGISHTHVNQRLQLLELLVEFQGMVSDLTLTVQKALPIAGLELTEQRALLEAGPPYSADRLTSLSDDTEPEDARTGKTLSRVMIKRHSTPEDIVETLRKKLAPELMDAVRKLLRD